MICSEGPWAGIEPGLLWQGLDTWYVLWQVSSQGAHIKKFKISQEQTKILMLNLYLK